MSAVEEGAEAERVWSGGLQRGFPTAADLHSGLAAVEDWAAAEKQLRSGGVTSTPGAPMSAGTCGQVAAQKRRGTSAAWLDFASLPIIIAWVRPDSKLSPSWRGLLFCCGRRGSSPQPHLLVEAPRGNRRPGGEAAAPQGCKIIVVVEVYEFRDYA